MIKITNISQENLESMSRKELIRLCELMGIEVLPRATKEMLVDDILDQLEQKVHFLILILELTHKVYFL